MDTPRLIF